MPSFGLTAKPDTPRSPAIPPQLTGLIASGAMFGRLCGVRLPFSHLGPGPQSARIVFQHGTPGRPRGCLGVARVPPGYPRPAPGYPRPAPGQPGGAPAVPGVLPRSAQGLSPLHYVATRIRLRTPRATANTYLEYLQGPRCETFHLVLGQRSERPLFTCIHDSAAA